MSDPRPITPEDLCWSEADGAVSLNAVQVAKILNEMQNEIARLREWSGRCQCMNCIVIGARR